MYPSQEHVLFRLLRISEQFDEHSLHGLHGEQQALVDVKADEDSLSVVSGRDVDDCWVVVVDCSVEVADDIDVAVLVVDKVVLTVVSSIFVDSA